MYWLPLGPARGAQRNSTVALLASAQVASAESGCGLPQGTNMPVAEACQPAEVLVLTRHQWIEPACSPDQVKLDPVTAVPANESRIKLSSWMLRSRYWAVAPLICCHWKATVALAPEQLTLGWLSAAPAALALGECITPNSAHAASRPARTVRLNLAGRFRFIILGYSCCHRVDGMINNYWPEMKQPYLIRAIRPCLI